jgi:hypothetical protein
LAGFFQDEQDVLCLLKNLVNPVYDYVTYTKPNENFATNHRLRDHYIRAATITNAEAQPDARARISNISS